MKNSKKLLCFLMAIVVMIGSMGLVSAFAETETSATAGTTVSTQAESTTALTGDPQYFVKFTSDMLKSSKWLSNNEMNVLYDKKQDITRDGEYVKSAAKAGASVTAKSNGSISLEKKSVTDGGDYQYAANLEIPVTDEMKKNYLKADNKTLYFSYYLTKANLINGLYKGEFTDCQLRIYTKFKNTYEVDINGTKVDRQIKLASLGVTYNTVYQQHTNKAFKLLGSNDKPLENLDNVESIIISLYNYESTKNVEAAVEMSGITYAGVPEITPYTAPAAAGKNDYVSLTDWSKHYLKSEYADTPATVKFSAAGGYDESAYVNIDKTTKLGSAGWVYMKQMTKVETKQINVAFDLDRDAFNKAIVTANQAGGTGKVSITCKFPQIKDTEGKDMQGEFQVAIFPFEGETYIPVQTWIDSNKEYTFSIDVSNFDINSVKTVKIALMAFWKYDPVDNVYYDLDKAKRYDKDGNRLTAKTDDAGKFLGYDNGQGGALLQESDIAKITADCSNGKKDVDITSIKSRFTDRIMNTIEGFVSPLYTGSLTSTTDTGTKTTATSGDGDYEFAGYHFYDFTAQAYAETYGAGTHASFVNYLYDGYYDSYEVIDKNYDKDNTKQGYKDPANPSKKVTYDAKYTSDYAEAKSLVSGGYQVELASPYPRLQQQHQAYYHYSGKSEDARLVDPNVGDHKNQKPQGETYDFSSQMKNALKYAKENPDPTKAGYLAIDVYSVQSTHGYKNTYNATYKAWCQKNNKTCVSEQTPIQFCISIFAKYEGTDISCKVMEMVPAGQKKTIYLDVSEIEAENITGISIAAQNYSLLANKEQGGSGGTVGITDVKARFSAIYVPGNKNTDLTTTTVVTRPFNMKDAKKIKKLYDALPGLSVDDYETEEDYNKLAAFIKAWSNASEATQKYCEEKYGIDYAEIGMLEADVYEKIFGAGSWTDDTSPETGDVAFPMMSLLVAGISGYVILRTRKKR